MSQSEADLSQATPERLEEDESYLIRPREIFLFLLFGLIPIGILYMFASQGVEDTRGQQFEQERRLLIDGCMKQLDDREDCRAIIDEPLMDCYKKFADAQGAVAERDKLRRCVTGREDDKFRLPDPKQKAQAGSDSVQ